MNLHIFSNWNDFLEYALKLFIEQDLIFSIQKTVFIQDNFRSLGS